MNFRTNASDRMRIDSSGNVLINTTDASTLTAGIKLKATDNAIASVATSAPSGYFGRLTSDGDIVKFRKDSTTVGSIGVTSLRMFVGTGDTGLFFNDQTDQIQPWDTSTNSARDAAIDLGRTDRRFKNLYLSNGAYLGGTAAANLLDDYEEGTWTPSTNIGYASITSATYTKVGNMVTVQMNVTTNAGPGDVSQATSVSGLPFSTSVSPQISFNTEIYGLNQDIFCEISGTSFNTVDRANNTAITRGEYGNKTHRITITYLTS